MYYAYLCPGVSGGSDYYMVGCGDIKLERLEKRLSSKRTALIIPAEMNFAEAELVKSFGL